MSSAIIIYSKFVKRLVTVLHKINSWLFMPSLLSLILLDIALRNLFTTTIAWSHEVSGFLLLSIFFIDLPYCLAKSEFLKVDLLYSHFSKFWQSAAQKFSLICCFIISIFIIWQALVGLRDMYEFDELAFALPIPLWPFSAMIAFSGLLLALQSLVMLFDHRQETGLVHE